MKLLARLLDETMWLRREERRGDEPREPEGSGVSACSFVFSAALAQLTIPVAHDALKHEHGEVVWR